MTKSWDSDSDTTIGCASEPSEKWSNTDDKTVASSGSSLQEKNDQGPSTIIQEELRGRYLATFDPETRSTRGKQQLGEQTRRRRICHLLGLWTLYLIIFVLEFQVVFFSAFSKDGLSRASGTAQLARNGLFASMVLVIVEFSVGFVLLVCLCLFLRSAYWYAFVGVACVEAFATGVFVIATCAAAISERSCEDLRGKPKVACVSSLSSGIAVGVMRVLYL
ncbi:hypothetical protein CMUS01_08258 [Colletotrichum musicola]|uniref:Transmembrane protein n=1 Tax=Colletotrichum musicola TaxID=2175873 RepID=A0A8H6NDT4_9PEZI|nr:hypothetical protein CMUS01_08258 [Colletotrichum musicola]